MAEPARAMKMVVTLKSGIQIRAAVEDFTTGASPVLGELRNLKWTATQRAHVQIHWLDISEVAAVHAEFSYGTEAEDDAPEAVVLAWCKGCGRGTVSVPCPGCGGPACAGCGRCPPCDGEITAVLGMW